MTRERNPGHRPGHTVLETAQRILRKNTVRKRLLVDEEYQRRDDHDQGHRQGPARSAPLEGFARSVRVGAAVGWETSDRVERLIDTMCGRSCRQQPTEFKNESETVQKSSAVTIDLNRRKLAPRTAQKIAAGGPRNPGRPSARSSCTTRVIAGSGPTTQRIAQAERAWPIRRAIISRTCEVDTAATITKSNRPPVVIASCGKLWRDATPKARRKTDHCIGPQLQAVRGGDLWDARRPREAAKRYRQGISRTDPPELSKWCGREWRGGVPVSRPPAPLPVPAHRWVCGRKGCGTRQSPVAYGKRHSSRCHRRR